ncbi:hypothetical protein CUMW_233160 [Citrus unshiu]|uniref:MADS-box domain-containing protein n=1 Tax=Citrus unshiu TaxID=55188 RepID=A0A2H5QID4_CITUN|nr:hypothetical protein CUMW_233160 [Citrus unshiu]
MAGIYKKATELVTLTGSEIAVVVFSQSGKPYTFGHRQVSINELNQQHNELRRQLDEEKEQEKMLTQMRRGKETQPPKKTKGRQKIEMIITFSKRRSGIYKNASELVTLTGSEIAIVVFSQSGKPYTFGHPSVEAVANRFLGMNQLPNDNIHSLVVGHRQVRINELNQQHNELRRQLDEEKEQEKILTQMRRGKETQPRMWETPVDEHNLQEQLQMDSAVDDLHQIFLAKLNERAAAAAASSPVAPSLYFHHK